MTLAFRMYLKPTCNTFKDHQEHPVLEKKQRFQSPYAKQKALHYLNSLISDPIGPQDQNFVAFLKVIQKSYTLISSF